MAIGVIKSAIQEAGDTEDFEFFNSPMFHFYAGIAYGGKSDYRSDEDIINDIKTGKLEKSLRKGVGRR